MNEQTYKPFRTIEAEHRVFNEPWEAQAFALTHVLFERGQFDWSRWSDALAQQIKRSESVEGPSESYYECWLSALEQFLIAEGIASPGQLAQTRQAWEHAAQQTPHGEPIVLSVTAPSECS
ncbi:MAG: nitrile hydratase accessory protein [Pseudomonadota bacterium]